jgi:hypothetical protein
MLGFDMIHSLEDEIKDLKSDLHKSELKIISLESELSTSKAWYKIAEEEMINLNKQLKGGSQ